MCSQRTRREFLKVTMGTSLIVYETSWADIPIQVNNWLPQLPQEKSLGYGLSDCSRLLTLASGLKTGNFGLLGVSEAEATQNFNRRLDDVEALRENLRKARDLLDETERQLDREQSLLLLQTLKAVIATTLLLLAVRAKPDVVLGGLVLAADILSNTAFNAVQLVRDEKVGSFILATAESRILSFGTLLAEAAEAEALITMLDNGTVEKVLAYGRKRMAVLAWSLASIILLLRDVSQLVLGTLQVAELRERRRQYRAHISVSIWLLGRLYGQPVVGYQRHGLELLGSTLSQFAADTSNRSCTYVSRVKPNPPTNVTPQ